jgi:hypothetical protein
VKWQALVTVIRDVGFLLVGFGGILYQQITGHVNPWLLAVYTTMLGIPGAIGLVQLGRGRSATPGIPGSSSSPPSSSSPQQQ